MEKTISLKRNNLFRRLYSKGKTVHGRELITIALKNNTEKNRIGITTSTKIGNAVKRNRARRVIREAYRMLEQNVSTGYDIVFIARSVTTEIKMNQVLEVMDKQLKKLEIIKL